MNHNQQPTKLPVPRDPSAAVSFRCSLPEASTAGGQDSKTEMAVSVSWGVPEPTGTTHVPSISTKRAATHHMILLIIIRPLFTPFPNVTSHIQHAIRAGTCWILINWRCITFSHVEVTMHAIRLLIAPGIVTTVRATCSLFPLLLAGQLCTCPLTKGLCIVPIDISNRVIFFR